MTPSQPSLLKFGSTRPSIIRRLERLDTLRKRPGAQRVELELCRRDNQHWFDWWAWTYDPRLTAEGKPAYIPFDLFARQQDLLRFIDNRVRARTDGLIEKSRDMGFTWEIGGWSLHKWLFVDGFKTSYGSYKEDYVDKRGEPDAFFEKLRMLVRSLPPWMLPPGFTDRHDNYMRLINPSNGNTVRGAVGDQMGRGGRCTVQLVDEAAFLERGDNVDAATSATSDVRIWASTVHGMSNVFARKRHGGALRPDQIFVLDYRDDPRKTPEWIESKKRNLEAHVWAAEYERDYAASVEGICILAKWVEAAVELGPMLNLEPAVNGCAGLDVGAGKARSVFVARFGPVVMPPVAWGDPDTIETAHRALNLARETKIMRADGYEATVGVLCYDSVGVGRGVLDALAHHQHDTLATQSVNVGTTPSDRQWPDGMTSVEKFANLKAELWAVARERFKASYEHLLFLRGEKGGEEHQVSDLVILPPLTAGPDVQILVGQLSLVKWFHNERGKVIMESKIQLATREIPSPDHAEAFILTFAQDSSLEVWQNL